MLACVNISVGKQTGGPIVKKKRIGRLLESMPASRLEKNEIKRKKCRPPAVTRQKACPQARKEKWLANLEVSWRLASLLLKTNNNNLTG